MSNYGLEALSFQKSSQIGQALEKIFQKAIDYRDSIPFEEQKEKVFKYCRETLKQDFIKVYKDVLNINIDNIVFCNKWPSATFAVAIYIGNSNEKNIIEDTVYGLKTITTPSKEVKEIFDIYKLVDTDTGSFNTNSYNDREVFAVLYFDISAGLLLNHYVPVEIVEPLTAQAGILTMTIDLINNTNNTKLCSSQLKITIHDSDTPTVPTIEEAQYHQLLQTINDNYNTLNETKLYKNFTEYESETNVNSDDLVAINKNGETKNAKLEDVYNIKTVNNVAPTNKNVTITSANIPHEDTPISDKLVTLEDSLNNKANVEDTVFFRDGGFIDDGLISTGLLNLTTDSHDVFGRIFLTETKFIGGDILTCDLELQITETTGGRLTAFSSFSSPYASESTLSAVFSSLSSSSMPISAARMVRLWIKFL